MAAIHDHDTIVAATVGPVVTCRIALPEVVTRVTPSHFGRIYAHGLFVAPYLAGRAAMYHMDHDLFVTH